MQSDKSLPLLEPGGRLVAIDALRGVAAILVVFYHLHGHVQGNLSGVLPLVVEFIFTHGYVGVPIFFVLSGFVIAMSTFDKVLGFRFASRFFLRRSLRLDPVYWAAILLVLGLTYLKTTLLGGDGNEISISDVLLHAVYLQDLFHLSNQISPVFWTLCLEIQFYLFFILCICALAWITAIEKFNSILNRFLFATFLFSTWTYFFETPLEVKGLFVKYWHFFASGVFLVRALRYGRVENLMLLAVLSVYLLSLVLVEKNAYVIATIITVVFIYLLGRADKLKTALNGGAIQFLGKISYSLYLTHPEIGWKFISVGLLIPGIKGSPVGVCVLFLLAVIISIVFAYLFFIAIEKPSLNLSKRIKLR